MTKDDMSVRSRQQQQQQQQKVFGRGEVGFGGEVM